MSLLYTHKIPHPANFVFAQQLDALTITAIGGDGYRIRARRDGGWKNPSQAELAERLPGDSPHRVTLDKQGTLQVADDKAAVVLRGVPGATFGRSGPAWLLQFQREERMQFYGLGEHSQGLEKSGQRVKFWNTDLIGDYYFDEIRQGNPNPMYVAMPWLIVKQGNHYLGLLVHHPGAVFMDLASNFIWADGNNSDVERQSFYVGAPDGQPDVYVLVGPDLAALTRKLQRLVGFTPLPPLWALGYHQSRWGYAGPHELNWLDRELRKRAIPCDGLWLDIDYMENYKVFTFSEKEWGGPAEIRASLKSLRARGRRVLAILDPGVKIEPGYDVYRDGLKRDVFCHNPAGKPFVGFVWPGHTHFPDFSLTEGRAWWAKRVAAFARTGMAGAWLDMNDPAVGATEVMGMRFDHGREPHDFFHNQYALGMARASHEGWRSAYPDQRPFLLSRSASISSARYTAVWTGDNMSNWHHLRMTIPVTLGLAMSGFPFNGADVCGFALDTNRDLAVAWYKVGFLFPFFRNHNSDFVREQEPWTFGKTAERIIAHYVRLRYKFLPYLYQLFAAQAEDGEAIVRPLFHDFPDRASQPLGTVSDQMMVGPALLHAPIVEENARSRTVVLPAGQRWFSLADGRWHPGGRTVRVAVPEASSPLFVREGSLLPLRPGQTADNATDLREIELHVFLPAGAAGSAVTEYVADDGETFGYQKGLRTRVRFTVRLSGRRSLEVRADTLLAGFGKLRVRLVVYGNFPRATVRTTHDRVEVRLRRSSWQATGGRLATMMSPVFEV